MTSLRPHALVLSRRTLWRAAISLTAVLNVGAAAQDVRTQLVDFTRLLRVADGLQVSLVHLNAKTAPLVFEPPARYAIRARAYWTTLLYVQGTTQRDVELDTSLFVLEQDDDAVVGWTTDIKNFRKGRIPTGTQVDGLIEFSLRLDLSKPFTVRHSVDSVEFRFTESQVRDATGDPVRAAPKD